MLPETLRRYITAVAVAISMLAGFGCAAATRQAAVTLADEGAAAAKSTESILTQTSGLLEPYVEGQFLSAAIRGTAMPGGKMLDDIGAVEAALFLRGRVMAQLAKAYAAMKSHASYDAAGEVETAVTEFTGSLTAYAAALPGGPAILSAGVAALVGKGAGAMAGQRQAAQLKSASRAIRERLATFRRLLEKEKEALQAIRSVTIATAATTARALASSGIGQPHAIVKGQLGTFGLEFDEKQFSQAMAALAKVNAVGPPPEGCPAPCTTKADRLDHGIQLIIARRAERLMELDGRTIDQHSAAMQDLIDAHTAFEKGEYINAEVLAASVETLRAIVEQMTKLRGA